MLLTATMPLLLELSSSVAVAGQLVAADAAGLLVPPGVPLQQSACGAAQPRVDVKRETIGEKDVRVTITAGQDGRKFGRNPAPIRLYPSQGTA